MTQDNFRYRSFRKRESKKRQKERHGKYTDTNWWIGREDVLVRDNRGFCSTKRRKKSFYSTFFPFIVSLSLAMAAPQCFSRRPRLSGNNISSLFALLYLWRPGSMATKRVEEQRRKRPERKVPSQASVRRVEQTREKWSMGEVACMDKAMDNGKTREIKQGETFMVASEQEREERRWPRETTEWQTWGRARLREHYTLCSTQGVTSHKE